ncbi:phage tail assembly protein [Sphingomonas sp. CBMAI 2297]|uniref:phage tail assembly protein n=1 Tax=Sphingomonas sp. CBMAI 2297 TaxID=2991720 RepID=UPI0024544719|nr:phage tail assembly protein [Sphingomonas sp. CBMAI 2297]MDH4743147.1 phage tail assembly protein [Sphingomonas sp. CBMAI 2297]
MTDSSTTAIAAATANHGTPVFRSFFLDTAIVVNGQVVHPAGTEIKVRKPGAPELRGLQISSLYQMDVSQLETLAPRITIPVLHKAYWSAGGIDPADITQFGTEVADFLLPKAMKPASPTA